MRGLTVSHVRQRVSLVSTPSKSLWTRVASFCEWPELELVAMEAMEFVTVDN